MKRGFNLSEVLITLGIVGIISAITLPTLIKNYQKTILVAQLKTTYTIVQQGFRKMLADDAVDRLQDTTAWQYVPEEGCRVWQDFSTEPCKSFFNELSKYLPIVGKGKIEGYKTYYFDGSEAKLWGYMGSGLILKNGAILYYASFSSLNPDRVADYGWIDVNGKKPPNIYGRDIFRFDNITSNGKLTVPNTIHGDNACCNPNITGGGEFANYSCVRRIIQNGWKMNY